MITKTLFDVYEGKKVHLYTISNAEISVGILDFGGILNFIKIKTSGGEKKHTARLRLRAGISSMRRVCGRYRGQSGQPYCGGKILS